jgi:NAD(P) transhydrogenase subunit alpha
MRILPYRWTLPLVSLAAPAWAVAADPASPPAGEGAVASPAPGLDFVTMLFVFMLATFIGIGVIRRVSRLLHTPLMSLTNAISAIAVVGAIIVAGGFHEYPLLIRVMGAVALFASMTNIISGFLITDRMLKMFKTRPSGAEAATAGGRPS